MVPGSVLREFHVNDPRMLWVNVTNVVLGVGVVILLFTAVWAVATEITSRIRRHFILSHELDRYMHHLHRSRTSRR